MKIIHLADIHWRGLSRQDEYRESFSCFLDQARELNPDVIYIGGDIVHNKTQGISPELIDCLCWWFTSLSDIAPTHVILGNHDGLVLNKDRQDAISPIIEALNNPNIFLYKDSGVFPISGHPGFNWCVFSCFDEPGWKHIEPIENDINIALFHGAVWGSKTDIDWEIEGDVTDDLFKDFDFSLLGDIHKKQFLNKEKTIAYCGSSIQQNYGEDPGKGFLFWDIRSKDDFDVKFYEIPHEKPFVTIDWSGSVDSTIEKASEFPYGSRFRIKSKRTLNQASTKQLQEELKRINEASEVVFKSDSTFDISKINTSAGVLNKENLRDSNTHKRLLREYYKRSDIPDENVDSMCELVERYMSQISKSDESLRNSRWQINSMKFDNLFSYGRGNFVNFENLQGITGIFGRNAKGKSSVIGSLMYGLFNTTDRGSIKNLHIINSRKNSCKTSIDISINGEPIRILRSTTKHQTRKGEVYASTGLQLYKIDDNGKVIGDLTEEQRRETEKILRRMIGTPEDFLMTSLASQGEMNTFIKEGATSRKAILTKFLDLEIFDLMHDIAKSESSAVRSSVKSYPDIDWDEVSDDLLLNLDKNNDDLLKIENDILLKRSNFSKLSVDLAFSDNPDIITISEFNSQKRLIRSNQNKVNELSDSISQIQSEIDVKKSKILTIDLVKSDFSIDNLRDSLVQKKILERKIVQLNHDYMINEKELKRQKKSIKKLNNIPCGDQFPKCKFIKDSHRDKNMIDKHTEIVKMSMSILNDAKLSLDIMSQNLIEDKIEKYESLVDMQSTLSIEISSSEISLNNYINDFNKAKSDLDKSVSDLGSMKDRLVLDGENPSSVIRSSIVSLEKEIKSDDLKRTGILKTIAEIKVRLEKIEEDRERFEKFKSELNVYDLFMKAVSKKGIPLQIILSQLPIINAEISKILHGVVGFTVELEANPDSNAMDVFINYGDSRRVIELASGMEKMMSSLAIRVALINVSSLTKTNMLIIDEGFGSLDESNIEACSRLLQSLKKWFRNIIIISHVDAIKDAVDNSLEIVKNEKDSKVFYE